MTRVIAILPNEKKIATEFIHWKAVVDVFFTAFGNRPLRALFAPLMALEQAAI